MFPFNFICRLLIIKIVLQNNIYFPYQLVLCGHLNSSTYATQFDGTRMIDHLMMSKTFANSESDLKPPVCLFERTSLKMG